MTGALDSEQRDGAVEIISDLGKSVTWTSVQATYNESSGSVTASDTPYTVAASPPEPYSVRMVDGSTILATDFRLTIAARDLTFTPKVGDKVLVDTDTFRVVGLTRIYSGDLVCTWEAQCRK